MMIDAFRTRFAVASQDGMEWNGLERARFRRPMRSMRRRRRRRRRVANESNRDSEKVSFIHSWEDEQTIERTIRNARVEAERDRRRSTTPVDDGKNESILGENLEYSWPSANVANVSDDARRRLRRHRANGCLQVVHC